MGTNAMISCNWTTPTDLVTDIQTSKLNATDIVAQCENICQFVFRSTELVRKASVRITLDYRTNI
jgi:hypothetical protein